MSRPTDHQGDRSRMVLPHTSSSVADARHRLAEDLRRHRVNHSTMDDAILVLSELLSNAIKHARPLDSGKIVASWWIGGGTVWVAVTDGGSRMRPRPQPPSASAVGGRGLDIVTTVANDWGVEYGAPGTTVWAVLRRVGHRSRSTQSIRF